MTGISQTSFVHAGRRNLARRGVHVPSIDLSTTYPFSDLDQATKSLDRMALGDEPVGNSIYARLHNPTVALFEEAIAEVEFGEAAVAFGSGMAAITAVLMAVKARGKSHIVAIRPLYGGTDHLLAAGLSGLEVTFAEPSDVVEACRDDTGLVILETPANPTLDLVDIESVVRSVCGVPVLVDSTFATPVLQNPLLHGAALVMHSATKYIGGHGDVMGGVIVADGEWAGRLRQVRILTGALLHPLAGYLLHRGLQTMPIRVQSAQAGAQLIAERLNDDSRVWDVAYPGLAGQGGGLVGPGKQMRGAGSMIAFRVKGGYEAAKTLLESVELITPAVSLGSVDTLIQHPAGLTHRIVSDESKEGSHIEPDLLRLAVGIETPEDIWNDLDRALDRAARSSRNDPVRTPPRRERKKASTIAAKR
ncbi:MAG: aminotransferase class I/II-fold pyridoxal phosphate-dependent enzyme [Gemmatimonadota bacterium]|nr:aminotransferase class I/II-fold pyridoxal phosphate-dependent enzyme [Gemmatimonadota bacterium]MDH5804418.1 aminotransferase class I/II-fold pyridoxal phosphate-dependent enzyme [Gemmatimonadota bacterium]